MAGLLAERSQLSFEDNRAARAAATNQSAAQRPLLLAQQDTVSAWEDLIARIARAKDVGIGRENVWGGAVAGPSRAKLWTTAHVRHPVQEVQPQQRDIVTKVAAIRDLIRKEQIPAARKVLDTLPIAVFEEPAMKRLRRALTPPTVKRSGHRGGARAQAYAWLRQNGESYRGRWVAVAETGLLAVAPTLRQLREQLKALAPAERPLIHKF